MLSYVLWRKTTGILNRGWFKCGSKKSKKRKSQSKNGIALFSIELINKRFYQTGGRYYQVHFRLFADAVNKTT